MKKLLTYFFSLIIFLSACSDKEELVANIEEEVFNGEIVDTNSQLIKLATGFLFLEGPTSDKNGNVYFTDQKQDKIFVWSVDNQLSLFMEKTQRSNGLSFDAEGILISCADEFNKLVSIKMDGSVEVLVESYNNKLLNGPNDLWIDTKGGIYFSDPYYKRSYWTRTGMEQDGQCVYYLSSDRKNLTRAAEGFVRPNGVVGNKEGTKLYIADIGDNKTYSYQISLDGTLTDKKLFAEFGSDGMTIDEYGNVYLCSANIIVFDPDGNKIKEINVHEKPTNVCFGGKDFKTLFITAVTSLYSLEMNVKGGANN